MGRRQKYTVYMVIQGKCWLACFRTTKERQAVKHKMVAKWRWNEWMSLFLDNRFIGVSIISVIAVQVR